MKKCLNKSGINEGKFDAENGLRPLHDEVFSGGKPEALTDIFQAHLG
jgi:hypothetical protein